MCIPCFFRPSSRTGINVNRRLGKDECVSKIYARITRNENLRFIRQEENTFKKDANTMPRIVNILLHHSESIKRYHLRFRERVGTKASTS
jgi:hypothetical protein